MRIVDSSLINEQSISKYIPRLAEKLDEIRPIVSKIINEVKNHGDKALVKFTREFDHINLTESEIKVSENEIETAYKHVEPALIDAIRYAADNIKTFHSAQRRDEWTLDIEEGVKTGQVFRAIESIGSSMAQSHTRTTH